jgi:membrane fusion protein (multidrug efflux system)
MKAKPVIAGIALLLVLILTAGGLWYWRHTKDVAASKAPAPPRMSFVDVVTAESTQWQPTAKLVGTIIAKRSISLANEIVGVVTEVGFTSGDTVEPGQVLLRLDATSELADLAAAEAALRLGEASIEFEDATAKVAQSNLALAQSNQRRFSDAATTHSVSASEVDKVNAEVTRASADLEGARASVGKAQAERDQSRARRDQIKTTIAKKTLVAPFRARAGMRTIDPGQYLPEGTQIVGLTELTDEIFLDFAIPQEYASRVIPGSVVMASSRLLGGDAVPIRVEAIDSTVNPNTRNVRIRSTVQNPNYYLKPGMAIDVVVPMEPAKDYVTIPTTAVRRAAFGDHVFVLIPGDPQKEMPGAMHAQQRMVTLGADLGGKVIVAKGLSAGEKIAAGGSFKLMEGALVLQSPPGGAPAGPGGPPTADKSGASGEPVQGESEPPANSTPAPKAR